MLNAIGGAATVLAGRYDVFHSNTDLTTKSILRDTVLVTLAKIRNRPVLLHLHGGRFIHEKAPPFLRWMIGQLLARSDLILALSDTEQMRLVAEFPGVAPKLRVVYNGADASAFSEEPKTRDPDAVIRVVFIGRLVREKGIEILVEAIKRLRMDRRFIFTFFGEGPLRETVEVESSLNPNVRYQGVALPDEIRETLVSTDIIVLPSLQGEGMPMAIVEGMAAAVIPIATPISSVPEIVHDGKSGLLIEPGSPESLVIALQRLADNPAAMKAYSQNAAAYARHRLCADQNFEVLRGFYADLASGPA